MSALSGQIATLRSMALIKIEVALTYLDDGAPHAAAERLRNAAQKLAQMAALCDQMAGEQGQ